MTAVEALCVICHACSHPHLLISYPCSCPCDICLSQPFLPVFLLCHALGQIRTDPAEGWRRRAHSHLAGGCDDMAFSRCFALCLKLSFLFFLLHTRTFFCFCTFVLRAVCACALSPQPTNAYLIATILTDMEQAVMNRISYSYNKSLIEQSWCDMRMSE